MIRIQNLIFQPMNIMVKTLAHPTMVIWVMPLVMLYLVVGTIAQKYMGLYDATRLFFRDVVIRLDGVPVMLPGFPILISILLLSLFCKIMFKSPWHPRRAGIIIVHMGVLVLLAGGVVTSIGAQEGYVDLAEGEAKSFVSDYHLRELAIYPVRADGSQGEVLVSFAHETLTPGVWRSFYLGDGDKRTSISLRVLESCRNCKIEARRFVQESHQGMATKMQIVPQELNKEDERNLAGLTLQIKDQIFLLLENIPSQARIDLGGQEFVLVLERQIRPLPFRIELQNFNREMHPGTSLPRAFQSRVRISEPGNQGASWESLIGMNEPLRYKGYTLYQASFIENGAGAGADVSVLAVVENPARIFPYISGGAICLGLMIHLLVGYFIRGGQRPRQRRRHLMLIGLASLSCLVVGLTPGPSFAQSLQTAYSAQFAQLPILHEGRIKPMESFARALKKEFSGRDENAIPWMLEALFNPEKAQMIPILKIARRDIILLLDLPQRPGKLYSYQDVLRAFEAKADIWAGTLKQALEDENSLSPAQVELISLRRKLDKLSTVLSSLSLFLPLNVPTDPPDFLISYQGQSLTYLEALGHQYAIDQYMRDLVARKGDAFEDYTKPERQMALLSFAMASLRQAGQVSALFKVIPISEQSSGQVFGKVLPQSLWQSPWDHVLSGQSSPQTAPLMVAWGDLAMAYHSQNKQDWQVAVNAISDYIDRLSHRTTTQTDLDAQLQNIWLETLYNQIDPFSLSLYLYAMGLLGLLFYFYVPRSWVLFLSNFGLWGGLVFHILGIGLRIYILGRPPVGTLYESVLFVGMVVVLAALWVAAMRPPSRQIWLLLAALGGVILHLLAMSQDQSGDTMLMLTAVLNTNFWLLTHVLTITAGYGFCILCSLLAHFMMGQAVWSRFEALGPEMAATHVTLSSHKMMPALQKTSLVALLFTAVGTVLGGIWADQSWGRFWGWDPKENGALLIVLWLVWLIHGRISNKFSAPFWVAGMGMMSVIVALSWFGVNLLNIGLHSYGFTDSAAFGLAGLTVVELAFFGLSFVYLSQHKQDREPRHV